VSPPFLSDKVYILGCSLNCFVFFSSTIHTHASHSARFTSFRLLDRPPIVPLSTPSRLSSSFSSSSRHVASFIAAVGCLGLVEPPNIYSTEKRYWIPQRRTFFYQYFIRPNPQISVEPGASTPPTLAIQKQKHPGHCLESNRLTAPVLGRGRPLGGPLN
jgi:hypothetical protein